jgi:hypothetical protein
MFNNHTIASWYNTIGRGPKLTELPGYHLTGTSLHLYAALLCQQLALVQLVQTVPRTPLCVSVCVCVSDIQTTISVFDGSTHERMASRDHLDDASMCPRTTASAW